MCVGRSPDRKEYLLTTEDGSRCLLARLSDNGEDYNIFLASDGEPPLAGTSPAFVLSCRSAQDPLWKSHLPEVAPLQPGTSRWTLYVETCDQCQRRGRRICGRRELARISHYTEQVGQGQICCMDVEIPQSTDDGNSTVWCPHCSEGSEFRSTVLTTRRPKWSARRKSLSLDFRGRCSVASAKNFQLEVMDKPAKVKLLFGKMGAHLFVLDFQKPMSLIQAFAAAVSTSVWK